MKITPLFGFLLRLENIFDDDDALDYVLYEDSEKGDKQPKTGAGCFGVIVLAVLPTVTILKLDFH